MYLLFFLSKKDHIYDRDCCGFVQVQFLLVRDDRSPWPVQPNLTRGGQTSPAHCFYRQHSHQEKNWRTTN
jgi:hypothetical protein